jgi:hypothetical protein
VLGIRRMCGTLRDPIQGGVGSNLEPAGRLASRGAELTCDY